MDEDRVSAIIVVSNPKNHWFVSCIDIVKEARVLKSTRNPTGGLRGQPRDRQLYPACLRLRELLH